MNRENVGKIQGITQKMIDEDWTLDQVIKEIKKPKSVAFLTEDEIYKINNCLNIKHLQDLKTILLNVFDNHGIKRSIIAKKIGISREGLYVMLSIKGTSLKIETVLKILHFLGIKLIAINKDKSDT
jgi:DNA-binding phage protein